MKVMAGNVIREGELVFVIVESGERRRQHLIKAEQGLVYSTIAGVIEGSDIIGRSWGDVLELQAGRAYLLPPTRYELSMYAFKRLGQVIYPKDQGYIAVISGIREGMRVLEAGVGSGFLTAVLASIVGCKGKVIGYDVREDMLETARRNLELVGLLGRVDLRLGDVREGVPDTDLDAVFLDMPDPWEALKALHGNLKPGAPAVVFVPTFNQLEKLYENVVRTGMYVIEETVEILRREIEVKPGAIRPFTQMVGHTGYIVLLRRIRAASRGRASPTQSSVGRPMA